MQGQRSAGSSFTETVDLNLGSVSNETGMNQSMAWNSMLNPAEGRSSNYMQSSADGNFTCTNAVGQIVRSSSRWDLGESSSSGNQQIQGIGDGLKTENGRYSWFGASPGSDARVEERQFRSTNFPISESVSSGVGWNQGTSRPSIMHGPGSSRIPLNINLNAGHMASSGESDQGLGPNACQNMYKLSGPQTEHMPTASASDNGGASSGDSGFLEDNDGGSTSSFSYWGSSCKRKALESTSGQSYPSGSSNCFQHPENFAQHGVPSRFSASSSLRISSPPMNPPNVCPEQLSPGLGIGLQGLASDVTPSMTGIAESSSRNYGVRLNPGHHESGRFNLLSARNATRHSDVSSAHQSSRPFSFTDPLELRPPTSIATTLNNHPNQSHPMHNTDLSMDLPPPVPWNGTFNSRIGGSSSSLLLSGDRGASLRDEADFGSTPRSSVERPIFFPSDEMRNFGQDPNNWNLSTGITSTSANIPSSSRFGASSAVRPFPNAWMPHHNPSAQNQQRLSEYAPWSLFPSIDTEAGGQRGQFPQVRSSASSDEAVMSSGGNNQGHPPYSRSALFMGVSGDDVNGWRALAADIDGRHRLVSEIRQVLNAMRRAENLRAEDYMFFDPFIDSVAELHDRHRDMRLDVDNMSYEELLALEERIGTVSTGLSEETIMKSMQQRKYFPIFEGSSSNLEPCCICQEEYVTGDNIGTLDCGHDFHPDCIKQWLKQKNLCPICKMTALGT